MGENLRIRFLRKKILGRVKFQNHKIATVTKSHCSVTIVVCRFIGNCNISRSGRDSRVWVGDKSGQFTTKSFFEIITRSTVAGDFEPHDMVWKNGVPSKMKVLAWLAAHKKVSTADLLQIRRPYLQLSPLWCVMCKRSGESLDHLLLHCSFVHSIWCNIRSDFDMVAALPSSWHNLLIERWYFKGDKKKSKKLWRSSCLAVLWCVEREEFQNL
ncbi:hypothetical protein LguiA_017971 [Lonicera macranthoides]